MEFALAALGDRPAYFFDLDMRKPLFRLWDMCGELERAGVRMHFRNSLWMLHLRRAASAAC